MLINNYNSVHALILVMVYIKREEETE